MKFRQKNKKKFTGELLYDRTIWDIFFINLEKYFLAKNCLKLFPTAFYGYSRHKKYESCPQNHLKLLHSVKLSDLGPIRCSRVLTCIVLLALMPPTFSLAHLSQCNSNDPIRRIADPLSWNLTVPADRISGFFYNLHLGCTKFQRVHFERCSL